MKFIITVGLLLAGAFLTDSVKVSIYYESLCPDSIRFIINQLYPSYYNLSSVIEVDFVPYGKANHTLVNGTWQFQCQHGEQECNGNKIQACALAQNYTESTNVEFITCVMGNTDLTNLTTYDTVISNCAESTNVSLALINECYNNGEGDEILASLGNRTHATQNTQVFVPTITYNDIFLQDLQDLSLTNFSSAFCSQVGTDQLLDYCGVRTNSTASSVVVSGVAVFAAVVLVNQL